jgi:hypothetical protein
MPSNPSHPVLDIEALRKRHKILETQKTTEEANLRNAEENLRDLKLEAMQKYETDDLDALRQKLLEMEAENERKRAEYQAHLQSIQDKLEEVKRQFAADAGGN